MNMIKKNGGFTLVELIVVIAILAILAGVAVPAYSGYITKAQDAAVITELDAIQTAAQAANATAGAIDKIELTVTDKKVTAVVINSSNELSAKIVDDFKLYFDNDASGTLAASAKTVTITLGATKQVDLTGTSYEKGATWHATDTAAAADTTVSNGKTGWNAKK